jgi:hypothetical protein
MFSITDVGGAGFTPISIAGITIGGDPGATSATVNSKVIATTLEVSANSDNSTSTVTIIAGAGALSGNVALPTAKTSQTTMASIGSAADIHVTTALEPEAISINTAHSFTAAFTAGAISVSAIIPTSEAGGTTIAAVDEGAKVIAPSFTLSAEATNNASVDSIQLSAGGINLNLAMPTAKTTHNVETRIGPAGNNAPNPALSGSITVGAGPIDVDAKSTNNATISVFGLSVGGISANIVLPDIDAGGSTKAHIGGKFTMNQAVELTADSTSTATGDAIAISVGGITGSLLAASTKTSRNRILRQQPGRPFNYWWNAYFRSDFQQHGGIRECRGFNRWYRCRRCHAAL